MKKSALVAFAVSSLVASYLLGRSSVLPTPEDPEIAACMTDTECEEAWAVVVERKRKGE